ncbi:MAG: hypothetical protein RLP44_15020 [Aggregatilineales bacterium]
MSACVANSVQVIPTARPTITPTFTITASPTVDREALPTATPSNVPVRIVDGPSPTPLFGPTRTPDPNAITPTLNPNAPRIEYFTSDEVAVPPGGTIGLFWSSRGGTNAIIYQLNRQGERTRLWNAPLSGSPRDVSVTTRSSDRGQVDFLLVVSNGTVETQQTLSIPLECPVAWYFEPAPTECPDNEATETFIIEQAFERGRMLYIADTNNVYVLFNDELTPRWAVFQNRYDPAIHPESDVNFPFLQPIARLGFLWRGNDTVRNRLGLAAAEEIAIDGLVQTADENLYITSANGTILQLLPNGDAWQIITLP